MCKKSRNDFAARPQSRRILRVSREMAASDMQSPGLAAVRTIIPPEVARDLLQRYTGDELLRLLQLLAAEAGASPEPATGALVVSEGGLCARAADRVDANALSIRGSASGSTMLMLSARDSILTAVRDGLARKYNEKEEALAATRFLLFFFMVLTANGRPKPQTVAKAPVAAIFPALEMKDFDELSRNGAGEYKALTQPVRDAFKNFKPDPAKNPAELIKDYVSNGTKLNSACARMASKGARLFL